MQAGTGLFDEMARLMTGAIGLAQGAQEEARTFMRAQATRVVAEMDLVGREEFEAVKAMAAAAREEADALKARVEALEAQLATRG